MLWPPIATIPDSSYTQ